MLSERSAVRTIRFSVLPVQRFGCSQAILPAQSSCVQTGWRTFYEKAGARFYAPILAGLALLRNMFLDANPKRGM